MILGILIFQVNDRDFPVTLNAIETADFQEIITVLLRIMSHSPKLIKRILQVDSMRVDNTCFKLTSHLRESNEIRGEYFFLPIFTIGDFKARFSSGGVTIEQFSVSAFQLITND